MAQIQRIIFLFCIATVYAASLPNLSEEVEEDFSIEMEDTPISKGDKSENGSITEYDPISPSFIISDELQSNGFQMGKSLVEGLLGMLQIVRKMSMSPEGLRNMSFLVTNMVSMLVGNVGRYYETFRKLMPVFAGIVTGLLETLR